MDPNSGFGFCGHSKLLSKPFMPGSIVFVHGTGVRLKAYTSTFADAQAAAEAAGVQHTLIACAWGDPLGVQFEGKSLPDHPGHLSPEAVSRDQEDFLQWSWLFDDPTAELDLLTIRDTPHRRALERPDVKAPWETLLETIRAYSPSQELQLLLERGGLFSFWSDAWSEIVMLPITKDAFEQSVFELTEAAHALARAVIAQLHLMAIDHQRPGPNRALRMKLFERLVLDWGQRTFGVGAFFANRLKRRATKLFRKHRNDFTQGSVLPLGDILLYQTRGDEVRRFILGKIRIAPSPVVLLGHSLGGIACVDLLMGARIPSVTHLITVGSQAPFLYEIGALHSLKPPDPLPSGYPPWLNIYDPNDFLSYVAEGLFSDVLDYPVESGQPFPDSHSAYFGNQEVWQKIKDFIAQ
jgi:hypothetical protein